MLSVKQLEEVKDKTFKMGIEITHKGEYTKVTAWLNKLVGLEYLNVLEKYGQLGVDALSNATPVDSGITSQSWGYEIHHNAKESSIVWTNSNMNKGVNIAVILQYGHGTRNGGYVQGRDYINPAIRPIFDNMVEEVWKEVTNT